MNQYHGLKLSTF